MTSHQWQPSVFLNGNIAEKITKIKQQEGPDLHLFGSANLVQTLLKHDLVDAFWLKIFPITLGAGKRLFADGTIPAAFKVTESTVTSKSVIIVNYERAGASQPDVYKLEALCGRDPERSRRGERAADPNGVRDLCVSEAMVPDTRFRVTGWRSGSPQPKSRGFLAKDLRPGGMGF
jgi:hypothetical protein